MASLRRVFSKQALDAGGSLDVYYTYDDVSLAVSLFDWVNPGSEQNVTVTINGVEFHNKVAPGTGEMPVSGLTLLPGIKGGPPRFPFPVFVRVD